MNKKTYLGDSVYVEVEYGMLKLTTENGLGATNTIFLELEVFENLRIFVERFNSPEPTVPMSDGDDIA